MFGRSEEDRASGPKKPTPWHRTGAQARASPSGLGIAKIIRLFGRGGPTREAPTLLDFIRSRSGFRRTRSSDLKSP